MNDQPQPAEAPEGVPMTAKQWRSFYLSRPYEQQMEITEHVLENSRTASECLIANHRAAVEDMLRNAATLNALLAAVGAMADDALVVLDALDQVALRDPALSTAATRLRHAADDVKVVQAATAEEVSA